VPKFKTTHIKGQREYNCLPASNQRKKELEEKSLKKKGVFCCLGERR
jgi:hypothetical protein